MGLSLTSAILLSFVALLIFTDKRLQAHPNKLIAYTCLADAFNFYNFFSRYVECGYGASGLLDKLFAKSVQVPWLYFQCMIPKYSSNCTIAWHNYQSNDTFVNTNKTRSRFWYFITETVIFASLFLNLFTILDLYAMLKNPF